eukprot:g6521.t1
MASWDEWSASIVVPGSADRAAIFGCDGSKWGGSQWEFDTQPEHVVKVAQAIASGDPAGAGGLGGLGCFLTGDYFMFVTGDGKQIYARSGGQGYVVHKEERFIVVAMHDRDLSNSGSCSTAAEALARRMVEALMKPPTKKAI